MLLILFRKDGAESLMRLAAASADTGNRMILQIFTRGKKQEKRADHPGWPLRFAERMMKDG
jgi:hypothetical protein